MATTPKFNSEGDEDPDKIEIQNESHTVTPDSILPAGVLGRGIRMVSDRKTEINAAAAAKFLEIPNTQWERHVRDRHVQYLAKAMERGSFHWEWVILAVANCKKKQYRMNGQHSMWAVLSLKDDISEKVRLLEYDCDTENDLRTLYRSFDRGAVRSAANLTKSALVGMPGYEDTNDRILTTLLQGFAIWRWPQEDERRSIDTDERIYIMQKEHKELAQRICAFQSSLPYNNEYKHLHKRAAVAGAMFATFSVAPNIAADFWTAIGNGLGLQESNDPRYKLRTFLQTSLVRDTSGGARLAKRQITTEYMYRVCVNMWNSFRRNEAVTNVRPTPSRVKAT
jgi:hypothetical protein